jgi:peptidoglycan/xylan/chitin deacetylase (PgdA/CDA1 family)
VTTHYKHDSIAKDFWTGYGDQIISVKNKKHEIASHSVSHVPDFDNSTIVQLGDCDEVEHSNYHPFYNGSISTDVTVCGEVSVSKQLLKEAANVDVKSFRAGYLAYNKNLLEGLESMNYNFNSSNSANDVLTSFPYQGHLTLSMSSDTSSILEIPNTISDVFTEDRISEDNYMDKVAIWKSVQSKNSSNHSPTVLLIHPNRLWKIVAEQSLIRGLSENTAIIPFEEYGRYWKDRVSTDFEFEISSDSNMIIHLNITEEKLNKSLSFSLKNGLALKNIQVLDADGKIVEHSELKLHDNDKLVYFSEIGFDHSIFTYDETSKLINYSVFPNPSNSIFNFKFSLINDANVSIQLYDELGNVVEEIMNQGIELGNHSISNMKKLNQGMYFYKISIDDQHYFGKVIVN